MYVTSALFKRRPLREAPSKGSLLAAHEQNYHFCRVKRHCFTMQRWSKLWNMECCEVLWVLWSRIQDLQRTPLQVCRAWWTQNAEAGTAWWRRATQNAEPGSVWRKLMDWALIKAIQLVVDETCTPWTNCRIGHKHDDDHHQARGFSVNQELAKITQFTLFEGYPVITSFWELL